MTPGIIGDVRPSDQYRNHMSGQREVPKEVLLTRRIWQERCTVKDLLNA
jgi:hypothetical protein